MEYSDTEQFVDESLAFPVAQTTVIEQIGTIEITSPSGDSVTLQETLGPVGEERYLISDALYTSIIGNLDETLIGRKYYDDQGGRHSEPKGRTNLPSHSDECSRSSWSGTAPGRAMRHGSGDRLQRARLSRVLIAHGADKCGRCFTEGVTN